MSGISFQNTDNFIRNMVTIGCDGAGYPRAVPISKRVLDRENPFPISIDAIADDLRLDSEDDLDNILRLGLGAAEFLERRTAYVLTPGLYEAILPAWWQGPVIFSRGPVREVTEMTYRTGKASYVTVDPDYYFETQLNDREFAVNLLSTYVRPDLWSEQGEIRLKFTAGYQSDGETGAWPEAPDGLVTCFIALIAHYYKNRELFDAGKQEAVEMGAGNLLNAYKMIW